LLPFLALLLILATSFWVYGDAKAQTDRGTPVFFSLGTFRIDTPAAWRIACVVVWIVFFPLYVVARSRFG
jgi:hypothetical protein